MQLLIDLLNFLTPYGTHSYYVMFAILIACGFGFPMPEDIVLITGGMLASRGITDTSTVIAVCMAGVLCGDSAVFLIGRKFGPALKTKKLFRRIISPKVDKRVDSIIQKYGDKVIFMARFMPGLRTPIFMTCGIYQVSFWKFLTLDGLAALISVPVWVYVGVIFGENLELLEQKIRQFQVGIYSLLGGLIALGILYAIVKKKFMNKVISAPDDQDQSSTS
jgi:membrane protein DedA with SNARE-associated domain